MREVRVDAGVVHQHVDRPVTRHDLLDRAPYLVFHGDVGAPEMRVRARRRQLVRRPASGIVVHVDEHHGRPFGGAFLDDGAADAAGATGHERNFAVQPSHRV